MSPAGLRAAWEEAALFGYALQWEGHFSSLYAHLQHVKEHRG